MYDDAIVNEVRKPRERLAGEFQFDVGAIFDDLRKRQAALGARLVSRQGKAKAGGTTSLGQDSAPR